MKRTKAYSFTHRTKVFADSTVRKNGVWPRENWQGLRWHRSKWTYKRKRSGERRSVSSRTAEWYLKRGESRVTGKPATE